MHGAPGIEWNKVTWYSKLGAIILFVGVVPALSFYIGTQYQLMVSAEPALISTEFTYPSISLPVVALHTNDTFADPSFKYSTTTQIAGPTGIVHKLAAYGAAYQVWLAPASWSGVASDGVDGTISVDLHPRGANATSSPDITYLKIPGCMGCMLSVAAPYFPSAMKAWNENFNTDGGNPITVPQGLQTQQVSDNVMRYSLPSAEGFFTRGVAYYGSPPGSPADPAYTIYAQATVTLPVGDEGLADFILNDFVNNRLKNSLLSQ
jgi:hypothetical protein